MQKKKQVFFKDLFDVSEQCSFSEEHDRVEEVLEGDPTILLAVNYLEHLPERTLYLTENSRNMLNWRNSKISAPLLLIFL